MRPPNTHWIRKFNERAKSAIGSGKQHIDNEEIRGVTHELLDVLAYVIDLENKINEMQNKIDESQIITVELNGENF